MEKGWEQVAAVLLISRIFSCCGLNIVRVGRFACVVFTAVCVSWTLSDEDVSGYLSSRHGALKIDGSCAWHTIMEVVLSTENVHFGKNYLVIVL